MTSVAAAKPDFSAAATVANHWTYLASYDLADPSAVVTGATGYATAGTDIFKNILVNVDGLTWLSMEVTARSAGSVTAVALMHAND